MALKALTELYYNPKVKETQPVKPKTSTMASGKGTATARPNSSSNKAVSSNKTSTNDPTLIRPTGSGTAKSASAQTVKKATKKASSTPTNRQASTTTKASSTPTNRQASTTTSATQSTSNSGGGTTSSAAAPTTDYRKDLLAYLKEQNELARQSAIDAIDQQVKAQQGQYEAQLGDLGDQYQALRNQSEVERYKTRKALRESQANRGQLDSGYGRQEALLMDTQYGNAINSINMQEQKSIQEIKNLIQQAIANGAISKNEVNNQYASAYQQLIAELYGAS